MPTEMIKWLAKAAEEARVDAGRKEVHIAAQLGADQSTINRFESGKKWPRNPDLTIQAYADDLEIDARHIWARALELWISAEQPSGERAAQAVRAATSASQVPRKAARRSPDKRRSTAKRRAAG